MKTFLSKHNIGLTVVSSIIMLLVISFTVFLELNEERLVNKETANFIEEYKTFDNKLDANNNALLPFDINDKIKIKYVDPSDAVDLIYNEIGILFVGTPDNQESRTAVKELIETAIDNKIDTIYYIDTTRYQTDWAVSGDVLKKYVYDDSYETLLNALDEYLGVDNYVLNIDNVLYDTGSKKINLPNVFAFKGGSVVGNYSGVGKNIDPFNMSNKEIETLKANYNELIMLTRHHNL